MRLGLMIGSVTEDHIPKILDHTDVLANPHKYPNLVSYIFDVCNTIN